MRKNTPPTLLVAAVALLAGGLAVRPAAAHCDTIDGPVAVDARAALASGDVAPVLKWVQPAAEGEIRAAFAKAVAAKAQGGAAAELAETWFLENLVRVHRAGEGAPYTGLKPAGEVEPGIAAADQALAAGEVDKLVQALAGEVSEGVQARFARVVAAREHAGHNVAAGRAYVAAYVEFIHYVEGLHEALAGPAHHTAGAAEPQTHAH